LSVVFLSIVILSVVVLSIVVVMSILFNKLEKMGIRGNMLNWFRSYLAKRTQKCDVNGSLSDEGEIDIGVLQGSTLGPILFLCYVNDLPNSTDMLSLLFADDTACLISDTNITRYYLILPNITEH